MPDSYRAPAPVPDRVRMPLLTLITLNSLDEDYQHVAERRRAEAAAAEGGVEAPAPEGGGRRRGMLAATVVAAFGLIVTVAFVQTSRNADVDRASRATLIERVSSARATVEDLQSQIASVRDTNAGLDASYRSLGNRVQSMEARADVLGRSAGFRVLRGDGVQAVVDDAPAGGDGMVRDRDLRLLVNGLWAAGAQGIAINGQRVTALSALRNSWESIRINDVSLSRPYVVTAVGDQATMQARFAESHSGSLFRDVTIQWGMSFSMDNVDDLELPAAPRRLLELRSARPGTSKAIKPPVNSEESP